MIHLDSNIVVAHLRGDRRVAEQLDAAMPDVALSTIVLAELSYGVSISKRPEENQARLDEFIQLVGLVVFDRACAEAYGQIRAEQRRLGRATGEADTLIAATALAHSATLVTHNTRHFEAVPGLMLADWIA